MKNSPLMRYHWKVMNALSDNELIQKYLSGDEDALKALFGRYLKPIYNFVYRYAGNEADAEDITQDAFVSVWKNIKKFEQDKSFKTWIFAIAKNAGLNWIKKKKPILFSAFKNENGENTLVNSLADVAFLPDEIFDRNVLTEKISVAMAKLSPDYQKTLSFYYSDSLNFREIAELVGESINTVKSRHRRAIAMLKKML